MNVNCEVHLPPVWEPTLGNLPDPHLPFPSPPFSSLALMHLSGLNMFSQYEFLIRPHILHPILRTWLGVPVGGWVKVRTMAAHYTKQWIHSNASLRYLKKTFKVKGAGLCSALLCLHSVCPPHSLLYHVRTYVRMYVYTTAGYILYIGTHTSHCTFIHHYCPVYTLLLYCAHSAV